MTLPEVTPVEGYLHQALFYCLQPFLLIIVISNWCLDPTRDQTYLITIVFVQLVLGFSEHQLSFCPRSP